MIRVSQQKLKSETLNIYRFLHLTVFLFLYLSSPIIAQEEMLTAENYFDTISVQYGQIEDYQAEIIITQEDNVMEGTIYYKQPNLLRIDFTQPEEQVLAIDGKALTIYIPRHSVIMHQPLKKGSSASMMSMASEEGLQMLKNNYSVAYAVGPDPVPLDEGSDEMVVKLNLTWRSTDEGFRQLELSIGENGLIRRIIGVTVDYEEIQFDFNDIMINQNIPEARFEYESPASANIFENFLFEPDF